MLRKEEKNRDLDSGEIIAFLGKGTEFKGVITYQGTVRIDGQIEGEVITEGTLIVGETAVIRAEINAGTVISGGKITGNITASEKIQLLPSAVHEGSLKGPIVIIEEGVRFNGTCEMGGRSGGSEGRSAEKSQAPPKKLEAAATN